MKARLTYLILTLILFLLCFLIVKCFAHQPFIRGFLGDFLVMGLLYFFIRSLFITQPRIVAIAVLSIALLIEGVQYLQLANQLGWQNNQLAVIVLGATFDPIDLLAYTLGMITFYFADKYLIRKSRHKAL